MTRTPPWDRLKELAEKKRDAHAQRLGALTRERDEAKQRLAMLVTYRSEYQSRLAEASTQGIDLTRLRNYQAFLAQLERAIAQQADIVAQAERSVDGAKAQWTSERQRVESFNALDERHGNGVARSEQRRAQKLADEWATRNVAHARPTTPDTDH
jgi:flagellar FliJ protein